MSVKTQFVQTCDSQVWSFQEEGGCQGMLLSEIRTRYPNIAWISSFGFLPRNGSPWVYQLSGCCQSWHQASGCTCWRCSEEGQEAAWMEKAVDIRPTCVNVGSYASELIKIQGYSSLRIHFLRYTLCLYKCYRSYLGLYGKGMCQLDVVLVVFIFPDSR